MAISILYGELLKEDDRDFTHKDLTKLLESEDEVISEIARGKGDRLLFSILAHW